MDNNKTDNVNSKGSLSKKTTSVGQTLALLLVVISAAAGAFFLIFFIYIMATDGLANMRGEPETGWGALFAIIFLLPLIITSFLGLIVGIKLRKRPTNE